MVEAMLIVSVGFLLAIAERLHQRRHEELRRQIAALRSQLLHK
jgi:hypothetical protein